MSTQQRELYDFHQPEQDKLWKIFDNVIQTHRFKQIVALLTDHECGRCAMGVIYSYCLKDGIIRYSDDIPSEWTAKFKDLISKHFHINTSRERGIPYDLNRKDKDIAIKLVKKYYKKYGTVSIDDINLLNDYFHVSFGEFRDLFKELDI